MSGKLRVVDKTMVEPTYILESSEFRSWVSQKVTEAKRLRDDLATEVTDLETQISARMARIADQDDIILRGEAALALNIPTTRPSPKLSERE
jgi:hypothetical protein